MNAFAQFLATGVNPYETVTVKEHYCSGSRFSPEELATLVAPQVIESPVQLPAFLDLTDEEIKSLDKEIAYIATR